jgi:uncharacterized protein (TIGR01777 family)
MPQQFNKRSLLPVAAAEAFAWHERPGAFTRITPPWERVAIVSQRGGIQNGDQLVVRTWVGPFPVIWVADHFDYQPPRQFRDVQTKGPFAKWVHTHLFQSTDAGTTYLEDQVEYELPLGPLGRLFAAGVGKKLARMFDYRHRVTLADLTNHHAFRERPRMKVLVTGATGMVGTALSAMLTGGGHTVVPLRRGNASGDGPTWNPDAGTIDAAKLEGFDAVVHLAGENVGGGRWTAARKKRILESRTKGTALLAETLAFLKSPPKTFLCASAIGYYGNRGDAVMTEDSSLGDGFLPDVCRQWEAACAPAVQKGLRVVNLRIGVILSPLGGALKKMLLPFKLGAAGILGNGKQYMSWITLDDVVGAIHHALQTESLRGPVNLVSPNSATNYEFTKTLGRVLSRPTIFPMPAPLVKILFGEMGEELLLSSTLVRPDKLNAAGYQFLYPSLEAGLRHLLGK